MHSLIPGDVRHVIYVNGENSLYYLGSRAKDEAENPYKPRTFPGSQAAGMRPCLVT
jgi:hypothetical protein